MFFKTLLYLAAINSGFYARKLQRTHTKALLRPTSAISKAYSKLSRDIIFITLAYE